jgi:hypothetical protein
MVVERVAVFDDLADDSLPGAEAVCQFAAPVVVLFS